MKRTDLAQLVEHLDGVLAAIAAGDLDATTAMTYRLEGAVIALHVALGQQGPEALAGLVPGPPGGAVADPSMQ